MRTRRQLLSLFTISMTAGCNLNRGTEDGTAGRSREDNVSQDRTTTDEIPDNIDESSIVNVQEYGAEGDGVTDDAAAIQRAIDDADEGDTVYFPEPTAYYNIALDSDSTVLQVDGDIHANNLTLKGEGPGTKIQLADNPKGTYAMIRISSPNNFTFTMRDLVWDGNKRNVDDSSEPGHCIRFRDTEASGTGDIRVEDMVVQNANTAGMSIQYGGVTVNRCTSRSNRTHGFVIATNYSGEHHPRPIIKNSLSINNTDIPGYYAIDCSGGKGIIEDCVLQNCENGTKTSIGSRHFTYRRVRVKNNDKVVMRNTSAGGGVKVEFEDVVAEGNGETWRMGNNGNYRVVDGSAILATNNGPTGHAQICIRNNAALDASSADVYSNRMNGGDGLESSTNAHGSVIANYYHYRNGGGPTGKMANLDIQNQDERDKSDLPGVPTASDVGAWSS